MLTALLYVQLHLRIHQRRRLSAIKVHIRLATTPQVFTMIVKEVEANGPLQRTQTSPIPITGDEGVKTPPPNDSLKASLSPPVGRLCSFRRIWQTNKCSSNVLNIITNGYVLPFLSKPSLVRFPLILSKYKALKRPSSGHLYPVSSVKECNRKGGKCKISRVLQSPVSSTQASPRWRPVIDLNRLNTFLHVEKFKMETPESIRTSLIPGEWVSSIDLSDVYLHILIHPNSRKYLRFCCRSQVFQFTSLPFGLAIAPQVFTMIVKEVEANGPLQRTHTSPIPG